MIIIEGYDGSGKTTLANTISRDLKLDLLHSGGPPNTEVDVRAFLARSASRMAQPCIQDRVTHISEAVYGMLVRPKNSALALNRMGDLKMARLVIYARPPDQTIFRNLINHKMKASSNDTEEHIAMVKNKAPTLIAVYDTVIAMARAHTNVVTYDYESMKPEAMIELAWRLTR